MFGFHLYNRIKTRTFFRISSSLGVNKNLWICMQVCMYICLAAVPINICLHEILYLETCNMLCYATFVIKRKTNANNVKRMTDDWKRRGEQWTHNYWLPEMRGIVTIDKTKSKIDIFLPFNIPSSVYTVRVLYDEHVCFIHLFVFPVIL